MLNHDSNGLTIVSQIVVKRESSYPNISQIYNITTAVGTFLFTIASYFQFKSNLILVELRRGIQMVVYTVNPLMKTFFCLGNNMEKYSLPMGGLFNFVSCPHYFCEILIYLSFSIILGVNHYVWGLITSWVILNQVSLNVTLKFECIRLHSQFSQVLSGWTSHQWYLKNLKNYPRRRKAVIPYIL